MVRLQGSGKTACSMAMIVASGRAGAWATQLDPEAGRPPLTLRGRPAGAAAQLIRASASRRYEGLHVGRRRGRPAPAARRCGGQGDQGRRGRAGQRGGPASGTAGDRAEHGRRSAGPRRPPPAAGRRPAGQSAASSRPGPRAWSGGRARLHDQRRPAGGRPVAGGEDLAPPGVDHRHHRAVPARRRRPPRASTSRLVTADHADPEPLGQPLGRGHPDPQPGEQARADVDGHRVEVAPSVGPACSSTWTMAGASVSAWRRRPATHDRGPGPVVVGHRHPDQLGGRLDAEQDHRPRPDGRGAPAPAAAASLGPVGPAGRPDRATGRRCVRSSVAPGRLRGPTVRRRSSPEDRGGHVAPLDQGHRAVLDQLGAGPGRPPRPASPAGRGRRGGAGRTGPRQRVLAHQGEGGAGHRAGHPEAAGEALGEGGLAGPEAADQQQQVARPARGRPARPPAPGSRLGRVVGRP